MDILESDHNTRFYTGVVCMDALFRLRRSLAGDVVVEIAVAVGVVSRIHVLIPAMHNMDSIV